MSLTSFFGGVVNTLTGGLANKIIDTAEKYFPPDMNPTQKAQFGLAMKNLEMEKTAQANQAAADAEKRVTDRIASLEGTANDLKAIPYVGAFVIFLRGCQRPIWGFATMYFDYQWFESNATYTEQQQKALLFLNVMVLVFLFGERSIKNVLPIVASYFGKK